MAVVFTETFDAGPDGAAITDANTAYDTVVLGGTGTGTAVFDSAQSVAGGFSGLVTVVGTGDRVSLQDDFAARGVTHRRYYVRIPSIPPGNAVVVNATDAGGLAAQLMIDSAGQVRIRDRFTTVDTAVTALTVDTWHRVEWKLDAAAGTQEARLFFGANSNGTTPDETLTGAYTGGDLVGFRDGLPANPGGAWSLRLDEVAEDDATFPGPEAVNTAPTADAGPDQTVTEGAVVTLDGTGSTDPEDGQAGLSYEWTIQDDGGTSLTDADITNRLTDTASFTAPDVSTAASIVIQLQVTDSGGLSDTDTTVITVEPEPVFPAALIDQRIELRLGGVWTDITQFVQRRGRGVTIRRGRSREGSQVRPGSCRMALNNRDGRFSPRNPRSPYFGLLGRNTPIRLYIKHGDRALDLTEDSPTTGASTPDSAALSITDELDVRIDATTRYWGRRNLIGKTDGPPQRSWELLMDDGVLQYSWSPDGTNGFFVTTDRLPLQPGRRAVRVTHVVDDGAGAGIVTFYVADTISGPWTQLEQHLFGAESMFDSTAPVKIGNLFGVDAFPGVIHDAEIRHGIDGTVVANPDFSVPAEGAMSFNDAASNTWTVAGDAVITNRRFRFQGEVSEWPQRWDVTGRDVFVPVEAAGILRRLGAGSSALDSAFRRFRLSPFEVAPVAYWPMEDDRHSEVVASALDSGRPMTFTRRATDMRQGVQSRLGADSTFQCSKPLPIMGDAQFKGRIPRYEDTGATEVSFLLVIPPNQEGELNSLPDNTVICSVDATGTAARWELRYQAGGQLRLFRFDAANNAEAFGSPIDIRLQGFPLLCNLEWVQDGADLRYTIRVAHVDSGEEQAVANIAGGETFGVATRLTLNLNRDLEETVIGHAAVYGVNTNLSDDIDALLAHTGETPFDRFDRLCREEGIPQRITGLPEPPWMGAQLPRRFVELAREMADTDSGTLLEPRDFFSLGFRTHRSIYNQDPVVTLNYAAAHLAGSLEPTDDDRNIRNDVTVSQAGGSSSRFVQETGPLSVQAPPDGVGRYDASLTVSAHHGEFLPHLAGWQVRLGTVDEARYPTIEVNLARDAITSDPDLVEALLFADVGDRLVIENPPDWLPPEDVSQIVEGYEERLSNFEHVIRFNCSPESPWRVAELDGSGATTSRYGTSGSTLNTAVGEADTTPTVADPNAGPGEVTEGFEDSDLNVELSGTWARSTASANTGSWSLKAAAITHNETTDAVVQVPAGATTLEFWYRVSSEETFDFFRFLIDGVQQFEDSGESGWVQSTGWDVSGVSEVTFRYVKDGSVSELEDTAYVDDVVFLVEGLGGQVWTTDPAEFPLDVMVGGERMTVTAIMGTSSPQTFAVVRSVNGVSKPHPAGTPVELFEKAYRAL